MSLSGPFVFANCPKHMFETPRGIGFYNARSVRY